MQFAEDGIQFVLKRVQTKKHVVAMVTETETHYLSDKRKPLEVIAGKLKEHPGKSVQTKKPTSLFEPHETKKAPRKPKKVLAQPVDPTMKQIKENFRKLHLLYQPGFSPDFCRQVVNKGIPNGKYMPEKLTPMDFAKTVVYYGYAVQWAAKIQPPDQTLRDMAETLAKEREPVNIAMDNNSYMKKGWSQRLQKNFGYKQAAYKHIASNGNYYPPNIMILATTPVQGGGLHRIHVINAIALALDNERQRDWKQLPKERDMVIKFLKRSYRVLFERIYNVAIENDFKTIVFVGMIGSAAFWSAVRKKLGLEYLKVIQPVFDSVRLKKTSIRTIISQFISPWSTDPLHFDVNKHIKDITNDTSNALGLKSTDLPRTVFVNAWDPYSIVGNGNCGDNSADGAFGCQTCMQVLTWPYTNPYIAYKPFPSSQ